MERRDLLKQMLNDLLRREGWPLYSNRAADRGGPTKGGITLHTLSRWRKRPCTIAELQALSETEAREIYTNQYIYPWQFVQDDELFEVLVDYAVTSWHDNPTRALQEILNVPVDGLLGPITRAAILAHPYPDHLKAYVLGYRIREMVSLALDDPKIKPLINSRVDLQIHNLRGWINRVTEQL